MNKNITNEYWLRIVDQIAQASTCRVKIGTVLIQNKKIIGVGFLGSIPGDFHCSDPAIGCMLVESPSQGIDSSGKGCRRTIHSEINAILQCTSRGSEQNGWIECFTSYQPCLWCLKCLLSIGVRKIIYEKPYKDESRGLYLNSLNTNKIKLVIERYAIQ